MGGFIMKLATRKGFTLIEILIVVIILGILAAIVIPQFTNASEDARKSSAASQLQTLRSSVELYKLQHGDAYPTADGLINGTWAWGSMLTTTLSYDGKVVGPYLQQTPTNPMNGFTAVGNSPAANTGWVFQTTDGRIFATDKTGTGLMEY
jgi:general secretion pathway protein G